MNYQQAEQDILTLIGTVLDITPETGAVIALPLPEKQADYYKANQKPVIFVGYMGSEYGENEGAGTIVQQEHAHFETVLKYKNVRGTNGIYQLESAVQKALIGKEITDFEKITIILKRFVEYVENEWHYQLVFKCQAMVVEDTDGEDIYAPLSKITIKSTYDPTWVQSDVVIPDPNTGINQVSPDEDSENNANFIESN